MLDGIKEEAVAFLFNLEVQVEAAEAAEAEEQQVEIHAKGLGAQRLPRNLQYTAPTIDGAAGAGGVAIENQQSAPALGVGGDNGRTQTRGRGGARPARGARPTPLTKQPTATAGGGGGRSALGVDGEDGGQARATAPAAGGVRRSGPASPTATGARKPSPGQASAAGGPSRNAPCYCGSGKKYKRCHGAPGAV
jgi:preprotein translocase subunit SecA